jgi:2-polyprenyl-3-methyl-5-hydroxy-6-metoxy-1,4-benzoquinol methylase
MVNLAQRNLTPELMDEPTLDPAVHRSALRGLATINSCSGSAGILWPEIHRYARSRRATSLRVLDVASGGGDVAIALWRKARRAGVALEIKGLDISPTAVEIAREAARRAQADISFNAQNVFESPLPSGFEVVMSSLFLHHLDDEQAVRLLALMRKATTGLLLVNDVRRTTIGFWMAKIASRVLTRSPIVHVDAPRSIERAFTLKEVRELCRLAKLDGYRLQRRWPQRFLLSWQAVDAQRRT